MSFVDTHCHIQMDYDDVEAVISGAKKQNVDDLIVVGTDLESSRQAIELSKKYSNIYPTVGMHPHDTSGFEKSQKELNSLAKHKKVVAIGEIGLDYYYLHASKKVQKNALKEQIKLGLELNLPFSFHIRGKEQYSKDAFDDFYDILAQFPELTGVIHSFAGGQDQLDQLLLNSSFWVGLNGIITFSKDEGQLAMIKSLDMSKIVLETDAPYLTPVPKRGTINLPENIVIIANFLAELKGVSIDEIMRTTTNSAKQLFNINFKG